MTSPSPPPPKIKKTVAAKDAQDLTPFGDELSGWWLLWNRWNPFSTSVNIPDMGDISSRLAFIRSTLQLEEVRGLGWG